MKDENCDVRLGVSKSLYDIFMSSDQALLQATNTIFGSFQKDNQYKIREKTIITISELGVSLGLEIFKNHFETLYFTYLTDSVSSVREAGIKTLEKLTAKFGPTWTTTSLIPKLLNFLNQPKTSYLQRMTVISSIAACAKCLNQNQVTEYIIKNLLTYLKDKIPNVRFFLIKILMNLGPYTDNAGKDKCRTAVKELKNDEDIDVKYFVGKFNM